MKQVDGSEEMTTKLGTIKAIEHNFADSFASGIGLLIGSYEMDVFAEAAASAEGFILVDFLEATTAGSPASASFARAVCLYRDVLPKFCVKHGVEPNDIHTLQVRFGTDAAYGRHFLVTVENPVGAQRPDALVSPKATTSRSSMREPQKQFHPTIPSTGILHSIALDYR